MRQITHVEIPAAGDCLPFYNPGGPDNNPTPGVRYTSPGPPTLQPVTIALDDPMWVTYIAPSILSIQQTDDGIRLTWPSGVDGFVLEETEALAPADWQPVATEPETIDNEHTFSIQSPADSSFYRLVK